MAVRVCVCVWNFCILSTDSILNRGTGAQGRRDTEALVHTMATGQRDSEAYGAQAHSKDSHSGTESMFVQNPH